MRELLEEEFLIKSMGTLTEILEILKNLPEIEINELNSERTGLIIVDMINGFTREGILKSDRIEALIPGITELSKQCDGLGIKKVTLTDAHKPNSKEFEAYPPHCVEGTGESEIVAEIKEIGGYEQIPKNSTNSFLEAGFREWLEKNGNIDTFILTGDCTDICILQLATSLKAWFNQQEKTSRIIVPMKLVDTYSLGAHDGDLMNVFSLYNMMINGVEIVKAINHIEF